MTGSYTSNTISASVILKELKPSQSKYNKQEYITVQYRSLQVQVISKFI